MSWLRNLFFPPPESSSARKLVLPVVVVGGVFALVLLALPPAWEFTNSPQFCGTTCHTMPPNFATYLASPHSRVPCVDCHIGRDLLLVQAVRKSAHMRLILDTLSGNYEYPIHTSEMRPARETCELCHSPEKFSDDSLRVINNFDNNRANDPYDVYLLMHTGGGSQREGLGRGIHWHIENEVSYIATDEIQQEIPWVRVRTAEGEESVYTAINSPVNTSNLEQYTMHEMDCMTCHNRISHFIDSPHDAVDSALHHNDLSRDIPFIRTRAIELLTTDYPTTEAAQAAFASLDNYYSENYPDFYVEGEGQVQGAIELLSHLYGEITYPEQKLDWRTHPDNIGHRDWPGCFRCHDGQHFSDSGEVIRLECNLCHSIPQVVRPGDIEPTIPISTGIEPTSHLDSTWIARHHNALDASCANCHTTSDAGGTSDTSFCSNSGCHGVKWEYAGFDAPGLATMLGIYHVEPEPLLVDFEGVPTYQILQPLFTQQCGACHGPNPSKGLRLTDYESLMAGGESGLVVVPGAPDESKMLQALESGHFARLADHQMALLRQWIADGAPAEAAAIS